jgi:hypothetical protein
MSNIEAAQNPRLTHYRNIILNVKNIVLWQSDSPVGAGFKPALAVERKGATK